MQPSRTSLHGPVSAGHQSPKSASCQLQRAMMLFLSSSWNSLRSMRPAHTPCLFFEAKTQWQEETEAPEDFADLFAVYLFLAREGSIPFSRLTISVGISCRYHLLHICRLPQRLLQVLLADVAVLVLQKGRLCAEDQHTQDFTPFWISHRFFSGCVSTIKKMADIDFFPISNCSVETISVVCSIDCYCHGDYRVKGIKGCASAAVQNVLPDGGVVPAQLLCVIQAAIIHSMKHAASPRCISCSRWYQLIAVAYAFSPSTLSQYCAPRMLFE